MKKLALAITVLLVLTFALTACNGNNDDANKKNPSSTGASSTPLEGNVHEGSFYKITLPEGWEGDEPMYLYGGSLMKSISIDTIDKVDGLDKDKAADFLGVENQKDGDIVNVKVGGYDAFKHSNTEDAQQTIVSYIFNAYDFAVMIYYNTDELDSRIITAIEAMEIFEKKENGNGNGNGGFGPDFGNPDPALIELIGKLYEGVDGIPMNENWEVTAAKFKDYLFIDYIEGSKGVMSQAMIDVQPHAVVLLELPAGKDAKAVAAEIKAAADPNKWICVQAEKAEAFSSGQYVVFVMSYKTVVDGIGANVSKVLK